MSNTHGNVDHYLKQLVIGLGWPQCHTPRKWIRFFWWIMNFHPPSKPLLRPYFMEILIPRNRQGFLVKILKSCSRGRLPLQLQRRKAKVRVRQNPRPNNRQPNRHPNRRARLLLRNQRHPRTNTEIRQSCQILWTATQWFCVSTSFCPSFLLTTSNPRNLVIWGRVGGYTFWTVKTRISHQSCIGLIILQLRTKTLLVGWRTWKMSQFHSLVNLKQTLPNDQPSSRFWHSWPGGARPLTHQGPRLSCSAHVSPLSSRKSIRIMSWTIIFCA